MWRPCQGWRGGRRCSMLLKVPPSERTKGGLVSRGTSTAPASDELVWLQFFAASVSCGHHWVDAPARTSPDSHNYLFCLLFIDEVLK